MRGATSSLAALITGLSGAFSTADTLAPGFEAAPERRLIWTFDAPLSLSNFAGEASAFLSDAAAQAQAASSGEPSAFLTMLRQGQGLLQRGHAVTQEAWRSFPSFATHMNNIYVSFQPLQPALENATNLDGVAVNQTDVRLLMEVVRKLLETAGTLQAVCAALNTVMNVFQQMSVIFAKGLSGMERVEFLSHISFEEVVQDFADLAHKAQGGAHALIDIRRRLGLTLERHGLSAPSKSHPDWEDALMELVPEWKALEDIGTAACPKILKSRSMGAALGCRVQLLAAGNVSSASSGALAIKCPVAMAATSPDMAWCPVRSGASVETLRPLGRYSGPIGWVYVVVAMCGLIVACASAFPGSRRVQPPKTNGATRDLLVAMNE